MKLAYPLGIGLFVVLTGCGWGDGPAVAIPVDEPSIKGIVTQVTPSGEGGSIRVEVNPDEASGSDKAVVRIMEPVAGKIARRASDNRIVPGVFSDLANGQQVKVWFEGPVAESYPVQARARLVFIDP